MCVCCAVRVCLLYLDRGEDVLEGGVGGISEREHVEVAHITWGDGGAPAARWAHGGQEEHILHAQMHTNTRLPG